MVPSSSRHFPIPHLFDIVRVVPRSVLPVMCCVPYSTQGRLEMFRVRLPPLLERDHPSRRDTVISSKRSFIHLCCWTTPLGNIMTNGLCLHPLAQGEHTPESCAYHYALTTGLSYIVTRPSEQAGLRMCASRCADYTMTLQRRA